MVEERPDLKHFPLGQGNQEGQRETGGLEHRDSPKTETSQGTILVKIGGSTLGSHDTSLRDLVELQKQGIRSIIVHGGGKIVSDWMQRQGVRPKFISGLRVTDHQSMEIVVAVLTGFVNKTLVSSIQGLGGRGVGLSGVDGGMIKARIGEPDLGLVGEVVSIDLEPIEAIMQSGYIPVVASVATNISQGDDPSQVMLNVNADTAAGEIAAAMGVERLIMLTDVEGVLDSSRRLIPRLTQGQARQLLGSRVIADGMVPKLGACLKALERVRSAHIVDGRQAGVLHNALADGDVGTRLT